MTVFVTELKKYEDEEWAVMTAETVEELHSMAIYIGIPPKQFDKSTGEPRYFIRKVHQVRALRSGARYQTTSEYVPLRKREKPPAQLSMFDSLNDSQK